MAFAFSREGVTYDGLGGEDFVVELELSERASEQRKQALEICDTHHYIVGLDARWE